MEESIFNFRFYYLYGLTDNPFRQFDDLEKINSLFDNVVGKQGLIIINSSFHPYQIISDKGISIWQTAYIQTFAKNKKENIIFDIKNFQARFFAKTSTEMFGKFNGIENDIRLLPENNPFFKKHVPFIIPFLLYNDTNDDFSLNWDIEVKKEMETNKNANNFIGRINNDLNFLLPKPTFVIGLDEFVEEQPLALIDNFIKLIG